MASINRSTLRKFERGVPGTAIEVVERLLQSLGYDLDACTAENKIDRILRQDAIFSNPSERSKLAADRLLGVR